MSIIISIFLNRPSDHFLKSLGNTMIDCRFIDPGRDKNFQWVQWYQVIIVRTNNVIGQVIPMIFMLIGSEI